MRITPGSRVLVEVSPNRWAFGTVNKTTSRDCEVRLDDETTRHWWTFDRVRPVAEAPHATIDHDFFAKVA